MLPPVEVATPIVVAEVVACLPPEGVTANAGARPLHEVASTLKTALGVDGTILEVIHQSCQQLGVQREGKTLVEAAAQCEAVLHGGRGGRSRGALYSSPSPLTRRPLGVPLPCVCVCPWFCLAGPRPKKMTFGSCRPGSV